MLVDIFPMAQWIEGTNQNSTPANDNTLRMQVALAPAIGFADSAPLTPDDFDQYVVGAGWTDYSEGSVVISIGGTWKEFNAYEGMMKLIGDVQYWRFGGEWQVTPQWVEVPATATSTGTAGQLARDATHFYQCIAADSWVRTTMAAW